MSGNISRNININFAKWKLINTKRAEGRGANAVVWVLTHRIQQTKFQSSQTDSQLVGQRPVYGGRTTT